MWGWEKKAMRSDLEVNTGGLGMAGGDLVGFLLDFLEDLDFLGYGLGRGRVEWEDSVV